MNPELEVLKQDFSGSSDYLSGVNDGMCHLLRWLNGDYISNSMPDGFETMTPQDRLNLLLKKQWRIL